ncbi:MULTISPECIES: Fe(3+) ABC transporter substrate-binding protein [Planococcus]|uniref:Fe(3+) ABC transporter substrate-binding protein n=2 Tax=Planococcus TaxID=1372 RepID=A0ABN4JSP4_9BACL|nr:MULTISPECIES: Fe(3+) ABC transporter substrate-binding protein [Planococcus]ALS77989.1 Fe(3+) ABC transporter substrate-binding protein [Planococcus kocurii]AQU80108.1 Fe(3+) ABC transporter substrate-binding protein [Planococcus faecalis]KAA0958619.1 Fe(3+) ABC transporter substrate-binding protein [Planococcus sp. ANT_H30]MDJ0330515.1 Fe(3+) ABC transporter substrate-binding protein [Planococcus sp. S3-L1]OHX52588.1 Fe(3+) ABC transporter substrate-binding protein [Planococcus faecalis]
MNKLFYLVIALLVLVLAACGSNDASEPATDAPEETAESKEVNLYTARHYDVDDELYKKFEEETGIKVNLIKGDADELLERIKREGDGTEADLFLTADAGRLYRAKEDGLLQSVSSDILDEQIPEKFQDTDQMWYGLTKRARVLVYNKETVKPEELSTYEALTEDEWNGRVLIRGSENIYNQSLLASFIEIEGEEKAKEWAAGLVNNFARDPEGGDRDQAKAIAAGVGDVAIMNSYYFGQMLNSEDPAEVEVAEGLGLFFPNQDTTGTHVNVSGAGVVKTAKNKENAIKLLEFLSAPEAQGTFAETNYEYPVNEKVEPSELLTSWGEFKEQDIPLSALGDNNAKSILIFNEVGWK